MPENFLAHGLRASNLCLQLNAANRCFHEKMMAQLLDDISEHRYHPAHQCTQSFFIVFSLKDQLFMFLKPGALFHETVEKNTQEKRRNTVSVMNSNVPKKRQLTRLRTQRQQ